MLACKFWGVGAVFGAVLTCAMSQVGCVSVHAQRAGEPSSDFPVPADARLYQPADIHDRCIEFTGVVRGNNPEDYRDCAVTESGEVGEVDGTTYWYAIYCLIPAYNDDGSRCGDRSFHADYFRNRGMALFARDASSAAARVLLERVSADYSLDYYERPQIAATPAGTMLYIPIVVDGTGHGNESEYYLRDGGHWVPVEATAWWDDLRQRIPAGLELWKGLWPDLATMTVKTAMYRAGDANCCPTGGTVEVRLAVRTRRFVVESVMVGSPEKAP